MTIRNRRCGKSFINFYLFKYYFEFLILITSKTKTSLCVNSFFYAMLEFKKICSFKLIIFFQFYLCYRRAVPGSNIEPYHYDLPRSQFSKWNFIFSAIIVFVRSITLLVTFFDIFPRWRGSYNAARYLL